MIKLSAKIAVQEVFYKKKLSLNIAQYSQETPVLELLFNKVAGP